MDFEIRPIGKEMPVLETEKPRGNEADLQNNNEEAPMIHETASASCARHVADAQATAHAMNAHKRQLRFMELSLAKMRGAA